MTTETEVTRHTMFHHLADMKLQRKHPRLLAQFENSLEAHLEALRQDHAALVESLQGNVALYQDAYENQKTLTRNACVYDRERYDELYQLRADLKTAEYDRELWHEQAHDATAKLAQGTESIKALHRVIKSQQNAHTRLQAILQHQLAERNQQQAEAHRQIMAAEAISDDRWEQLEQKQEIIVSQRKRIEELQNALLSVLNPPKKPSLWAFLTGKKNQAQPLPKKTA